VPAAAVKRGGRALFIMTGRKAFVDGKVSFVLKIEAQLLNSIKLLLCLSLVQENIILFVRVKSNYK
jgi:hypothetical protein